jgi:hypothetical protein
MGHWLLQGLDFVFISGMVMDSKSEANLFLSFTSVVKSQTLHWPVL